MRFLLPILAITTFAVAADVPGEVPVSTPVIQHAPGDQNVPAIAGNGSGYLAAWFDGRGDAATLYASRLGRGGEVLDETGLRIPATISGGPAVLWHGDRYVIIWTERRLVSGNFAYEVRVARIDFERRFVDGPRTVAVDGHLQSVATNGSRLVVSYTRASATEQRVAVLDRDAVLIRDLRIPSANGGGAAVASNGSGFVAVWLEFPTMVTPRIDAIALNSEGQIEGSAVTIATGYPPPDLPLVASDGRDYLVVLRGTRDELPAMRLDPSLRVVTPLHASGMPEGSAVQQPRLVWAGGSYVMTVANHTARAIEAVRLDRDGSALGPPVRVARWESGGLVAYPALAATGSEIALVFNDSRNSRTSAPQYDVFAKIFDASLQAPQDEILVSRAAARQQRPSIATAGVNTLVAWIEESGIYFARIAPDGRHLDGRGVRISEAVFATAPDVTFNGEYYLIAWTETVGATDIARLARVDPATGVAVFVTLHDCARGISIASGAEVSLAAWRSCRGTGIEAIRIDRLGHAIDTLPISVRPQGNADDPVVASNGSTFLVAWEERIEIPSPVLFPSYKGNIRAARVTTGGTLLDPEPIPIAVTTADTESDVDPDVASDGADFLVVWSASSADPSRGGIRARYVTGGGVLAADSFRIRERGAAPSVVRVAHRYLAAWEEQRETLDIVGAYVEGSTAGSPFAIAASPANDRNVAVAWSGGIAIAAYTHVTFDPAAGGVERAFVRSVGGAVRHRAARR